MDRRRPRPSPGLWLLPVALMSLPAAATPATEPAYPLDDLPRQIEARGPVRCPKVEMVRYKGDVVRYHRPVRVYVGFRERLRRFEEVVREVAIEHYGRAPRRIVHIGTYNCRRIKAWPTFLSEHGIGNGIDVRGFDFAPARGQARRDAPTRRLRRAFKVRLASHWGQRAGDAARHAAFLRALADRLVQRRDIFRVLLGPAEPGHKNHFHFDMAPWRLVNI